MSREQTAPSRLGLVGGVCGLLAAVTHLVLVRLLVSGDLTGLPHLAVLSLAVPGGPGSALVWDLGPLTWFDLPPAVVHLLAPLVLSTAGLVAGRLSYATRAKFGALGGLPVVLGFAPPMLLVWWWAGGVPATTGAGRLLGAVVVPLLYPLVFGTLGGIVGVKT